MCVRLAMARAAATDAEPLLARRASCGGAPLCCTFAARVAATASLSGLAFGYEIGIIDGVLSMDSFRLFMGTGARDAAGHVVELPAAASLDGWIVASFLSGAVLGSLLVAWLADARGRRESILIGGALFALGGAAQAGARGVASLALGRVVSGAGVGLLSSAAPLYITEAAAPAARGRLVAAQQLAITVGVLLASGVNAALLGAAGGADAAWRGALAAQVVPGAAVLALVAALPRSPRWLVARGRRAEAAATLARLRDAPAGGAAVEAELAAIDAEVAEEEGGAPPGAFTCALWRARVRELLGPAARRARLVAALQAFQQLSGINIILYFASNLIEKAGAISRADAARSLVVGNSALLVLSTLPAMALLDSPRAGRRALLIGGAAAMAAAHAATAACLLAGGAAYGAVAAMMLFTAAFAASWGPTVWVMTNEVLPLRVRAQGAALGATTNWLVNAVLGKVAPLAVAASPGGTFAALAAVCALMCAYAVFCVPETAARSLEDLAGDLWREGKAPRAAWAAEAGGAGGGGAAAESDCAPLREEKM